ncbi:protein-L-isoaspartate O-methyltransferase family protein [Sphingomonas sp.]|jgi:protein-L-isoaspartate(D-aspartate) O-methyltransferase|uniref:protein-L-isoaspartate O-methyltransferase family protein n=1 Tax=Sphingomonas sp. TaxID=28214 RepID=UPI002ED93480
MTTTGSQITPPATTSQAMRNAMVASQLRTNAVNDRRVVNAMATVAREDFLPAEAAIMAYRDAPIPLGHARWANLPMATGRLLAEAYLLPTDSVLLIGAAAGYTAAVLSGLVARVVAVESDSALAAHARAALSGHANVTVVEAPLHVGHADGGPYDVLIVDGAIPGVPDTLVAQVRPGGRAVSGIVDDRVTRLAAGRRTDGGFALASFVDCECVVLPGFAAPKTFTF